MLALIEELLDFSKIEAGKIDIEHRPFALATLIEDITELLAPRAQARNLEIAAYVDERLPAKFIGDAARLRQVLLNLAGNAIKFTSTGGVALIVEPGIWPGEISFLVRDTGIGIAPEAQERIFHEFEQVSPRNYSGTGLGLSISERLVKRMGGRITLESAEGAGATFEFTIPLSADPNSDAAPAFIAPDLTGKAVMLVATQTIEASLVARRLERWGAQHLHRFRSLHCEGPASRALVACGACRSHDRRSRHAGAWRGRAFPRLTSHRDVHPCRTARNSACNHGGLHRLSGQAVARCFACGTSRSTVGDARPGHSGPGRHATLEASEPVIASCPRKRFQFSLPKTTKSTRS